MNYADMARLSPVLRMAEYGPAIWCPACEHAHVFNAAGMAPAGAPNWTFDGNAERPTFAPSMLVFSPEHTDTRGKVHQRHTICHSFVRPHRISQRLRHDLKGQTVDLPVWPE